jgi:hypothetical protein
MHWLSPARSRQRYQILFLVKEIRLDREPDHETYLFGDQGLQQL